MSNSTQSSQPELFVGFMSGTSCDGVDASLVSTDGDAQFSVLADYHLPYDFKLQNQLKAAMKGQHNPKEVENQMTGYHAIVISALIGKAQLNDQQRRSIRAIGFHGQTIRHDPEHGWTWQIGNPHLLAVRTGIDVVHDFRRRDMALGGQGAPLVPIFHRLLARDLPHPVTFLNIGGVANVTYVDGDRLIAFDTGPGNALIDDLVMEHFQWSYDESGKLAAEGTVDEQLLEQYIKEEEFFKKPYPKSADRNQFHSILTTMKDQSNLSAVDQLATVTRFTVISIVIGLKLLPALPKSLLICGGGAKNLQILAGLEELLQKEHLPIRLEIRKSADFIESQAFAYLAARFFRDLPSAFPETTGCEKANVCGCLVKSV